MSEFERLEEGALARLSEERLIAYVTDARASGEGESAKLAIGMVAFRLEPLVQALVARKVARDDCDDVAMEALESFVRSAFDGKVIDSARAFVTTITKRRIADYYRAQERNPGQQPLAGENLDDESIWGEDPSIGDGSGLLGINDAIERVLDRRSDLHRRMIMLYAPEPMGGSDMSGAEVVERMQSDDGTDVSVDNVQQVWRRFKVELEKELSTGDGGRGPDG